MRKGFTIIELLVYIGIFSVVVVAFVTIFISIVRVQSNQSSEVEVESQVQFVLQQIQYYVEQSNLIDLPLDTATTTLVLETASSSENPTTLTLASGTLYVQQTVGGSLQALSSQQVTISNLSFTRHTNGTSPDSLSVGFTLSYNTSNTEQTFSQPIETSIAALNRHGIGYLSQFGSSGPGNGQFSFPEGIAVDSSGNVWVSDFDNNRVEEFNASGTYLSQFGSLGSGNGQLNSPQGVAVDSSGNVWVADTSNHRVEEFNASGAYLSQFGSFGYGNGQFDSPYGVAVDSSGNVWVSDLGNNRVEELYTR
jgi:type II secretory pathway pseudopilin PulG